MLSASTQRTIPGALRAAMAAATVMYGCSGETPSDSMAGTPTGSSGAPTAGTGTAGVGSGGIDNSTGGAINLGGDVGGAAGGSAGIAAGGSGSGGGASGGAGGSAAGRAGAGGAAGGAGAASGAAGTSPTERTYSTDPKTFSGEPRCQGFDVCESFESTEVGMLPAGFTLAGYGTRKVGVSQDRALRGARSLKFEIGAQAAATAWLTRGSLGALGAQHFGRAFFRIDAPAPTEFVHFDLLEASGPYQGHTNLVRYASTGTGVGTSQGNWSFIYNVQPSGNGAGSEFGTEGNRSAHARVADWMCLEWSFDASKQVAQYYLDGTAIDYLRIDTERAEIPVFDSIAVGFGKYQNTGAFLVYMDEVAFDGERIGCNN